MDLNSSSGVGSFGWDNSGGAVRISGERKEVGEGDRESGSIWVI